MKFSARKVMKISNRRYLVTCALPYANARLHLGHLRSTYIPGDVFARYLRLKGEEVAFICASDCHGSPIALKAEKEGISPEEVVERYHKLAEEDLRRMGCSFDFYGKTLLPAHYELVQEFFNRVKEGGYISEAELEQPYCPNCERFLPDRYVEGACPSCQERGAKGDECPACGRFLKPTELKDPYCVFCKSKPETKKAKHLFFKLSEFRDFLEDWLRESVHTKLVRTYASAWLKEGLKDWCISRDMGWGVPIPLKGAEGKVLYVWFDAPIGYISATKAWAESVGEPELWKRFWQDREAKVIHFIGKGIIYHHALFWPAMLRAEGTMNLPASIVAGGHYSLEGRKMSKSEGWVVEVCDYLKDFDPDLLRYYLMATPLEKDADFSWKDFAQRCNSELADVLGNFIHRTLTFIRRNYGGVPRPGELDEYDREMLNAVKQAHESMKSAMDNFSFHLAIKHLLSLAAKGNKYLNDREPWKTLNTDPPRAATTLYICSQLVKALAIWIEPFLPFAAERLWSMLRLPGNIHQQSLEESLKPIDVGHEIGEPSPLFRKIGEEEIKSRVSS